METKQCFTSLVVDSVVELAFELSTLRNTVEPEQALHSRVDVIYVQEVKCRTDKGMGTRLHALIQYYTTK